MRSLSYLDISGNNYDARDLTIFMEQITKENRLKWLSLAFNRASTANTFKFVNLLNRFIHYSDTLMHIDLSAMDFSPFDADDILHNGIGKSRTLLSAHLSGIQFGSNSINKMIRPELCTPITVLDQEIYS